MPSAVRKKLKIEPSGWDVSGQSSSDKYYTHSKTLPATQGQANSSHQVANFNIPAYDQGLLLPAPAVEHIVVTAADSSASAASVQPKAARPDSQKQRFFAWAISKNVDWKEKVRKLTATWRANHRRTSPLMLQNRTVVGAAAHDHHCHHKEVAVPAEGITSCPAWDPLLYDKQLWSLGF